jgi:hypothetical protein
LSGGDRLDRILEEGQEDMNITKTTVLQLYEAVWERRNSWREFFVWTFAFGAVVTVLSGVLYAGS